MNAEEVAIEYAINQIVASVVTLAIEPNNIPSNETNANEQSNAEADEVFEVDKIVGRRISDGQLQYLVRWTGFGQNDDLWVPVYHLNCPDKLEQFESQIARTYFNQTQS